MARHPITKPEGWAFPLFVTNDGKQFCVDLRSAGPSVQELALEVALLNMARQDYERTRAIRAKGERDPGFTFRGSPVD